MQITQEQLNAITLERDALKATNDAILNDMRTVKKGLFQIAKVFGMIKKDGSIDENIKIKSLISSIGELYMKSMMPGSQNALKEQFSFVGEIIPLAEKYKNI